MSDTPNEIATPPPGATVLERAFLGRNEAVVAASGRSGHWAWNPRDGSFLLDDVLRSLLGPPDAELPDTAAGLLELIAPRDRRRVEREFLRLLSGQVSTLEVEHQALTLRDEELWVLTRGAVLRAPGPGPSLVIGTCVDITARHAAETVLRAERDRLYSVLDRLPVFLALIAPDHTLRFTNHLFREEFGATQPETCHFALHRRRTPCEVCPTFDVFETKSLTVWDTAIRGRHYQIFDYPFQDGDGSPLVLQLGFDVTRMYKAQRAMQASEERYRSITDNLALGIAVLGPDLRVQAANPKMRQWFDVEPAHEPLCHEATRFCVAPGPCQGCPCLLSFVDGAIHETLFENVGPEGRSYRVVACPIFGEAADGTAKGRVDAVIEMVDDVTEKLEVQSRLRLAEKVQALGTLAGGLAHEINQPLNALHLYASGLEMLLEKDVGPDRQTLRTRIGWIVSETEKIRQTITHMRALARDGEVTVGPTNLNAAVMRSLKLISAQLEAHGTGLDLDLDPDLPRVAANPVQLEQVLLNLVINAMHALDDMEHRDKRVTISAAPDPGAPSRVLLVVADNGPGLGGRADRIFDPFYTTKDAGRGMGLGLSLVHTFVTSWGGSVTARDRAEGGAVFTVRLAATADD
ncbi:MAG: histidine kinase [Desulfovibrionaceae bacterium]|nr:histidine kinase [Desulfovibrionaceae bacterium]